MKLSRWRHLSLLRPLSLAAPNLVVLWYGQAYAPAGRLPIIATGVVSMSVLVMLTQSFTSRGKLQINILVGAVASVGDLALNVLLIPRFGIVGAGLASRVSYSVAGGY